MGHSPMDNRMDTKEDVVSILAIERSALQNAIETVWRRSLLLIHLLRIEWAEMISILYAWSWWFPLAIQSNLMETSPYLQAVARIVPQPLLAGMTGSLLFYQVVAILLGGFPSVAIPHPHAERIWLKIRREGIRCSIFMWSFMAAALWSQGTLTPGTMIHAGAAVYCGIGLWQIGFQIATQEQLHVLREIQKLCGDPKIAEV